MASSLINKINFYTEFKKWYFEILEDFDFDYQMDLKARNYLSQILKKKTNSWDLERNLIYIMDLIQHKKSILIYGCGPSLEQSVNYIINKLGINIFKKWLNFTADGAIRLLKKKNIHVDANFTDLDGISRNDFIYSEFNIVHAHGDNIKKLEHFKKDIVLFENLIPTSQVEPIENVINPGGFTDGDRIVFFLKSFLLPEQNIYLIGMDFDNIVGKYSKLIMTEDEKANPIKKKKLNYAKNLIEWLANKIKNPIFLVNSDVSSQILKNITLAQFIKMILNQSD